MALGCSPSVKGQFFYFSTRSFWIPYFMGRVVSSYGEGCSEPWVVFLASVVAVSEKERVGWAGRSPLHRTRRYVPLQTHQRPGFWAAAAPSRLFGAPSSRGPPQQTPFPARNGSGRTRPTRLRGGLRDDKVKGTPSVWVRAVIPAGLRDAWGRQGGPGAPRSGRLRERTPHTRGGGGGRAGADPGCPGARRAGGVWARASADDRVPVGGRANDGDVGGGGADGGRRVYCRARRPGGCRHPRRARQRGTQAFRNGAERSATGARRLAAAHACAVRARAARPCFSQPLWVLGAGRGRRYLAARAPISPWRRFLHIERISQRGRKPHPGPCQAPESRRPGLIWRLPLVKEVPESPNVRTQASK